MRRHFHRAHGVVVSHPLRMRKALGSNPSVSISSVSTRKASELLACRFIFPTRIQQTSLHLISKDMLYCPARRSGDQWRSGSTSASHAKGGVFKPQCSNLVVAIGQGMFSTSRLLSLLPSPLVHGFMPVMDKRCQGCLILNNLNRFLHFTRM